MKYNVANQIGDGAHGSTVMSNENHISHERVEGLAVLVTLWPCVVLERHDFNAHKKTCRAFCHCRGA